MATHPHDTLFRSAFEAPAGAAALLRELVPRVVRELVAWETLAREDGSFVEPSLPDRHSDRLFWARLRRGPGLVYLLLEHQSTEDPALPQRVLSYQSRIWDRFRKERRGARLPPVIAVLVSHVPGGWTAARSFEELFDPELMALPELAALVPRFSLINLDLASLTDADLAARALAPYQKLALWLLRDARDPERLLGSFEAWRPLLIEAGQGRSGDEVLRALIEYIFQVIDPVYRDELRAKIQLLGRHTEEITMTIAEQLREEGRAETRAAFMTMAEQLREQVRADTRAEAHAAVMTIAERLREECRIATLRSQLQFKFGALDAASEARLQAATPEAVDRYLQRVLVADSLGAVFAD